MPGSRPCVENIACTLDDLKGFFLEENGVVYACVYDVRESGCLENGKVKHVVHTDDLIVLWARAILLFDPKEALFRVKVFAIKHKLDAFHLLKLLLIVRRHMLLS